MIRELKRLKIDNGVYHPLLAVDIENNPDTGAFICAGIYGEIKYTKSRRVGSKVTTDTRFEIVEKYCNDLTEFHEYILSLKKGSCLLIFYNLPYDKVYFDGIIAPPTLSKKKIVKTSVLTVGTRVITMTLKNGIKCMDLFNHTCEGSLEQWGIYTNCPVNKAPLPDNLTKETAQHYSRVMNDAKITYHVGKFIQDFYFNNCQTPMKLTVGATSLCMFTKNFFTDYWTRDNEFLSIFERQAYYGGRAELFQKGELYNYSYDINSTYLSIMRDELLPDMSSGYYVKDGYNWQQNYRDYLGIFHVRVYVPDTINIPILPVRLDKKLKFPTGEFDGVWCNIELKEAERIGCKILYCYDYIYYKKSKKYFSQFASFVWDKRKEYKALNNSGMEKMIKRMGNSLYGKFAQRNNAEIFCRLKEYPAAVPDGSEFIEYRGEMWVIVKGESTPAKFEFPAIAAFITSYARIKLYKGIEANADTIIYCDTDSNKLTAPAKGIIIGNELGQWKNEGEQTSIFYRPKFYGDKHKGVPKTAGEICRLSDREKYINNSINYRVFNFKRPTREREAVRRGLIPNQWLEVEKVLTFTDDKRVWSQDKSTPIKYNDKLLTN